MEVWKKHLLRMLRRDSNSADKVAIEVFLYIQDIHAAIEESENLTSKIKLKVIIKIVNALETY